MRIMYEKLAMGRWREAAMAQKASDAQWSTVGGIECVEEYHMETEEDAEWRAGKDGGIGLHRLPAGSPRTQPPVVHREDSEYDRPWPE